MLAGDDYNIELPPAYNPPSLRRLKAPSSKEGEYYGALQDGSPHGFGIGLWKHYRKYEGEWKEGQEHGQGRETWLNGSCYSGEFAEGLRSGYGVYVHCDSVENLKGLSIEGRHTNPERFSWCGFAIYAERWQSASAGWAYLGQFKHGGRHGFGAIAKSNGELFEGQFQADKTHGFGIRLVGSEELWLESWDQGEKKLSYNPGHTKPLMVPVEVSLNRLRWSSAKMTLNRAHGEMGGTLSFSNKSTGQTMGTTIEMKEIQTLKVGDPITHSFIIQYKQDDGLKKVVEVQAGSDSTFRLVFLALRFAVQQVKSGVEVEPPFNVFWFKKYLQPLNSTEHGRFIRGSQGIDERFLQKVRFCVGKAEKQHLDAFNACTSAHLSNARSLSDDMVASMGMSDMDALVVHQYEMPPPPETGDAFDRTLSSLTEADSFAPTSSSGHSELSQSKPHFSQSFGQSFKTLKLSDTDTYFAVTEEVLNKVLFFLKRVLPIMQSNLDTYTQRRDLAKENNDTPRAELQESRRAMLADRIMYVEVVVPILEQSCFHTRHRIRHCWGLYIPSEEEVREAMEALKRVRRVRSAEDADDPSPISRRSPITRSGSASPMRYTPGQEGEEDGEGSPSSQDGAAAPGFILKRSAITTALLLQSKRQRETLNAEYAEAEKLLKGAKIQFETTQAQQRVKTQELQTRLEAVQDEAEAERREKEQEREQKEAASLLAARLGRSTEAFKAALFRTEKRLTDRQAVREALAGWEQYARSMRAMRRVTDTLARRQTSVLALVPFMGSWAETAREAGRLSRVCWMLVGRGEKRALTESCRAWRHHTKRDQAHKLAAAKIVQRWRKMELAAAWASWDEQVPTHNLLTQCTQLVGRNEALQLQSERDREEMEKLRRQVTHLTRRNQETEAVLQGTQEAARVQALEAAAREAKLTQEAAAREARLVQEAADEAARLQKEAAERLARAQQEAVEMERRLAEEAREEQARLRQEAKEREGRLAAEAAAEAARAEQQAKEQQAKIKMEAAEKEARLVQEAAEAAARQAQEAKDREARLREDAQAVQEELQEAGRVQAAEAAAREARLTQEAASREARLASEAASRETQLVNQAAESEARVQKEAAERLARTQAEAVEAQGKLAAEAREMEAGLREEIARLEQEARKREALLRQGASEREAKILQDAADKEARLLEEAREAEARLRQEAKEAKEAAAAREIKLTQEAAAREAGLVQEAAEREARMTKEAGEKLARLQQEGSENEARMAAEARETEAMLRTEAKDREARAQKVAAEETKFMEQQMKEKETRLKGEAAAREAALKQDAAAQLERTLQEAKEREEKLAQEAAGQLEKAVKEATAREAKLAQEAAAELDKAAKEAQAREAKALKEAQAREGKLAQEAAAEQQRLAAELEKAVREAKEREAKLAQQAAAELEKASQEAHAREAKAAQEAAAREAKLAREAGEEQQRLAAELEKALKEAKAREAKLAQEAAAREGDRKSVV